MGAAPSVLMKFEDIDRMYAFGQQLYQGTRSAVHRVSHRATGMTFACRTIYKSKLCSLQELRDVQQEVRLYQSVARSGSPHIVQFIQSFEDKQYLHIITEECTGGDLFERIIRSGNFSEQQAAQAFAHVASAVEHMHSFGVVHRDIKPENFLYLSDSADAPLKLIHLKSAVQLSNQDDVLDDVVGSITYVAPEMLRGTGYGKEVDVWSAGVLLYEMLCGYPPFMSSDGNNEELFEQIVTCPLDLKSEPWPHISPAAKDLVRRMLTRDPARRLTATQVLQHQWFKEQYTAPRTIGHLVLQNLRMHQQYNQFKKAVLVLLASTSSKDELGGLMQLFESLDRDKDGHISVEELRKGLIQQGINVAVTEVARLLDSMDADGNNCVDSMEFIAASMRGLVRHVAEGDDHRKLRDAFERFDRQDRGFVTREDLKAVLLESGRHLSEDELHKIMSDADTNGDGRIDYEEFVQMMLHGEMQGRVVDEQSNKRLHVNVACMERLRSEPLRDVVFEANERLDAVQSVTFEALVRKRSRAMSHVAYTALTQRPSTGLSGLSGRSGSPTLEGGKVHAGGGDSVPFGSMPHSSLGDRHSGNAARRPPRPAAASTKAKDEGVWAGVSAERAAKGAAQIPTTPFAALAVRFSTEENRPPSAPTATPAAASVAKSVQQGTTANATDSAANADSADAAAVAPVALAADAAADLADMMGKPDLDMSDDPQGPHDVRTSAGRSSWGRSSAGSVVSADRVYIASGSMSSSSQASGGGPGEGGFAEEPSLTGPAVLRLTQVPEEGECRA